MPILELKNQISHRRVELFAAAHSAHLVFTQLPGVRDYFHSLPPVSAGAPAQPCALYREPQYFYSKSEKLRGLSQERIK